MAHTRSLAAMYGVGRRLCSSASGTSGASRRFGICCLRAAPLGVPASLVLEPFSTPWRRDAETKPANPSRSRRLGGSALIGLVIILRNDVADDGAALRAGEPDVQALILHRELCCVDAKQIQHRCMAIMHADGILDSRIPQIVGGAVGQAFLDAAAREHE